MIEDFLLTYARLVADKPEAVSVQTQRLEDGVDDIIITTSRVDTGKIIGKDGKMINAIKTVIVGACHKSSIKYKITVKSCD